MQGSDVCEMLHTVLSVRPKHDEYAIMFIVIVI